MLRVLSFASGSVIRDPQRKKVGKRGDVRAAFSLGLEVKHQCWIVFMHKTATFLSRSQAVKGIVHPKLKFYPFIVHHFAGVGFGEI